VALQSWALWVARATGLPFTTYAADGARVTDVVERQIPAFERVTARPDATYDLGCIYIGVNDVRAPGWNAREFGRQFRVALGFVSARCVRVLTMCPPLDLGRPRVAAQVAELNEEIERAAAGAGALIVDLREFRGRNLIMADHVHPTAFGQIAIAERALTVLERDGVAVRVSPRSLIQFETTARGRLRGDLTYAYRHAKVSGRAAALSLKAAARSVTNLGD
jgi:hypothetical protein